MSGLEGWGGISSTEMRIVDENAEWLGVPRSLLMENAGAAVARAAYEWLGGLAGRKVVVFCGIGNNGGDGMAAARHMASMGARVTVALIGDPGKVKTEEAQTNMRAAMNMKETIRFVIVRSVEELEGLRGEVEEAEAVVDAVFGTGIRGSIREPWRTAMIMMNSARGVRVAVDIPSGVNPDTGEVADIAIEANVTVTFHRPKLGLPAAGDYCGEVVVAPIGIPPEAELVMGPGDARAALNRASQTLKPITLVSGRAEAIKELLNLLDTPCTIKPESLEGAVTYLGKGAETSRDLSGAAAIVSEAPLEEATISVLEEREAEELGFEAKPGMWDSCKELGGLALSRGQVIYLLGERDLLSDGRRHKASWVNRPLTEKGRSALLAVILMLIARGVEPVSACAAAGYLAGVAEERGAEGLLEEVRRLSAGKR